MTPGTGLSPDHGALDIGISEKNASVTENESHEQELDDQNLAKSGKPPRNLPVMRHCISQEILAGTSALVS